MRFYSLPYMGILGFLFGCCITVIFALLFIPANQFWPSSYEDRRTYLETIMSEHYTYRSGLALYTDHMSRPNSSYKTEEDYLSIKARMLCYSIEQEADDETHASLILATWAPYCDSSIMFYTSPRLLDKLKPPFMKSDNINLVYIDPSNSTLGTLLKVLKQYTVSYKWFTYVPPRVFLLPNNLKYYLVASNMDPLTVAFAGKPRIGRLLGTWEVSESSPLAISVGAITVASKAGSCASEDIADPGCLIEVTGGRMLNLRDVDGNELITSVFYNNFWVRYNVINVKESIKTNFPVSVHLTGDYKRLIDLEYYMHRVAAYGIHSGAFIRFKSQRRQEPHNLTSKKRIMLNKTDS